MAAGVLPALASCDPDAKVLVTTSADGPAGSLRAAITSANRAAAGRTTPIVIEVPAGTYELSLCGADDTNGAGDLDLTTSAPVTIAAKGAVTIRQTCPGERVLEAFGSGLLTLTGVTVTGGRLVGTDAAQATRGGGVRTAASLKLQDARISGNSATGAAGGSDPEQRADSGNAQGGGVYVGGALEALSSILSGNTVTGGRAPDSVSSSPGAGGPAEGGGAFVVGAITVSGGAVNDNTAQGGDGAFGGVTAPPFAEIASSGAFARGGGLAQALGATAPVEITSATLSRNYAHGGANGPACLGVATHPLDADGGALAASGPVTLHSVRATQNLVVGGTGTSTYYCHFEYQPYGHARGGAIAASGSVAIENGEFSENEASGEIQVRGGAVYARGDLTITSGSFIANQAGVADYYSAPGSGGAVFGENALSVQASTLKDNLAGTEGGAVSGKAVTLRNTVLEANTAVSGTGGGAHGDVLVADGVTVARNKASGGGGLSATSSATVDHSVISDNRTRDYQKGGGGIRSAGSLTIRTTQLARNSGAVLAPHPERPWMTIERPAPGLAIEATELDANAVSIADHPLIATPASPATVTTVVRATRATLVNCTVTGNSGALSADTLTLTSSTVVDSIGSALQANQLTTQGSAVATGNAAAVCAAQPSSSGSYNWFEDASCGLARDTNRQQSADFLLGGLADHGGGVLTRMPAYGSVLVDQVPAGACPVGVDARGTARPQASACDIGAVELVPIAGLGASNLAVQFSTAPPTVVPGTDATWQLTVTNHGPHPAAPSVQVQIPSGLKVASATIAGGDTCSLAGSPLTCAFGSAIPVGGAATIVVTGRVDAAVITPLTLTATAVLPNAQPPLEDDVAQTTAAVTPKNDLRIAADQTYGTLDNGSWSGSAQARIQNLGPSYAVGTTAQPIRLSFIPDRGVTVQPTPDNTFVGSTGVTNIWDYGAGFGVVSLSVSGQGAPPARLGVFELQGGLYAQPSVSRVPLTNADLQFFVTNTAHTRWEPSELTFRVTNNGPGNASFIMMNVVVLDPQLQGAPGNYQWRPSAGEIQRDTWGEAGRYTWHIPALNVGQSVTLQGTLLPEPMRELWAASFYAGVKSWQSIDFVPGNNDVGPDGVKLNEPH